MPKRFSKIRASIKEGLEGTDITAWKAWRRGETKINAKNVTRGPSIRKILSPFHRENFNEFIGIKVSGRAFPKITEIGLTDEKLGLQSIPNPIPATTQIRKVKNFSPAKMTVFVPTAGAVPTTPKSTITTLEYSKIAGESFTLPFGKRNVPGYRSRLEAMATLEAELTPGVRATFSTENF